MQLERFEQNGLELLIDLKTGAVFASQSATARMCEEKENTIRAYLRSQNIETLEVQAPTGKDSRLRTVRLLDEDNIYLCLEKYNPSMLKQCSELPYTKSKIMV